MPTRKYASDPIPLPSAAHTAYMPAGTPLAAGQLLASSVCVSPLTDTEPAATPTTADPDAVQLVPLSSRTLVAVLSPYPLTVTATAASPDMIDTGPNAVASAAQQNRVCGGQRPLRVTLVRYY